MGSENVRTRVRDRERERGVREEKGERERKREEGVREHLENQTSRVAVCSTKWKRFREHESVPALCVYIYIYM